MSSKLKKIVKMYDYRMFKSETCRNGGTYGFWTKYERIGDTDEYQISYHTTADMDFCRCCGEFINGPSHYNSEDGYECSPNYDGTFGVVSEDDLEALVDNFETTPKEWIEQYDPDTEED